MCLLGTRGDTKLRIHCTLVYTVHINIEEYGFLFKFIIIRLISEHPPSSRVIFPSMAPIYNVSVYGRAIIIDEGFLTIPATRISFVVLTALLGTISNSLVICNFSKKILKAQNERPIGQMKHMKLTILYVLIYLGNQAVHTFHYIDNIARPVDYLEPKWLYQGYILAPMEITFYINWPTTIGGTICIIKMFSFRLQNQVLISKRCCYGMFLYILISLMTIMHYRIAPPSSYSFFVNFTICGEGVMAVLLILATIVCLRAKRSSTVEYGRIPNPGNRPDTETGAGVALQATASGIIKEGDQQNVHRRSSREAKL